MFQKWWLDSFDTQLSLKKVTKVAQKRIQIEKIRDFNSYEEENF